MQLRTLVCAFLCLTPSLLAQDVAPPAQRSRLGLPALPPVTATSPMTSMLYADRADPGGDEALEEGSGLVSMSLPSSLTGTGFSEPIVYQLGDTYDRFGPAHPLVVAYHGFASSANSPSNLSTVDEECNARGWVYLSPTGLDDQLFGPPISQIHVETAIQWMLDNHNVDPERIYMVGFSMGAGVAANFAARHRDPDGIMIAALGLVSAGLDWTLTYDRSPQDLKDLMENVFNFGGPPSTHAFNYQQASVLYFDPATYPPAPGVVDPSLSMGSNLGPFPTYITYDDQDPLTVAPEVSDVLETLILAQGGTVTKRVFSGTADPHSWSVLDEVECLDFFDGRTADRYPMPFDAIQDLGGKVSNFETTQAVAGEFTYVGGRIGNLLTRAFVDDLSNVGLVTVDLEPTILSSVSPMHFDITNDGLNPARVELKGFDLAPSRLHQSFGGQLVTLVDSDPIVGSLLANVPGRSLVRWTAYHDPNWDTVLTISPSPVGLTEAVTFQVDGPATSQAAWLVISDQEVFTPVESLVMTAFPVSPAILFFLGLDINGDLTLNETIPNDPILAGIRLPTQIVTVNSGSLESVSNLWGFYIE